MKVLSPCGCRWSGWQHHCGLALSALAFPGITSPSECPLPAPRAAGQGHGVMPTAPQGCTGPQHSLSHLP